jgi:hypothetical protein
MPRNFNADDRFTYLVLNTLRPCRDDTCQIDDIVQRMPVQRMPVLLRSMGSHSITSAVRQRFPTVSINPSVCAGLRRERNSGRPVRGGWIGKELEPATLNLRPESLRSSSRNLKGIRKILCQLRAMMCRKKRVICAASRDGTGMVARAFIFHAAGSLTWSHSKSTKCP